MRLPWQRQRNREADDLRHRADVAYSRVMEALATQTAQELLDDDAGWRKLGIMTGDDFTPQELEIARQKCVTLWHRDPGIKRAAALLQSGTFGKGITTPRAVDSRVQQVIDRFWNDEDNALHLTSRDAQVQLNLALMLKGEVVFTVNVSDVDSQVKIGQIEPAEITQVVTHPDTKCRPVLYQRKFRNQVFDFGQGAWRLEPTQQTWYYIDWRYMAEDALAEDPEAQRIIDAAPDVQQDVYLYHLKVNTIGLRGIPEVFVAYDWAKAHQRALSDLATWTKAAAMFAWKLKMETKSQTAIDNAAAMFREPVPGTAAVHVANKGVELDAVDQPRGSGDMAKTVREMHLQSIRAFPFGEQFYADASTGNLATATAMELPAIWGIEDRQELFAHLYQDLGGIAIARAMQMQDFPTRRLPSSVDTYFDIDFPPAQPEQVLQQAQAITALAPLIDPQEAAQQAYLALGCNDIDQLLERQFPQEDKLEGQTAQVDTGDVVATADLQAQALAASEPAVPMTETASGAEVIGLPFRSGGRGNE